MSKDGIPFIYHEFEVVLLSENKQQFSQHFVSVIFPLGFKESKTVKGGDLGAPPHLWPTPKRSNKGLNSCFLLILIALWQSFSNSVDERAFPTLKELLTRLPEGCPLNLEVDPEIRIN